MTGTVAGGTSTTVVKDTKLNGPSVSIASGAVVLMTKAARVGIVDNESCAGLRLFLIVPANFWRNRNLERHGRIHTAPPDGLQAERSLCLWRVGGRMRGGAGSAAYACYAPPSSVQLPNIC